ncbi:glycosyltransferase [Blastococcus sp. HT6-30]|uniref:glycosyltransferase n=1 Tax=Blastococcus sp. HT6-30 TaxID=3144843 RepID=UPI00321B662C
MIIVRGDTRAVPDTTRAEDRPRSDYTLLRKELGARFVDLNDVQASRLGRLTRAVCGTYAALAVTAFRQRGTATAFVSNSENEAIILALLLKLTRRSLPIVAVGQFPAKPQKWAAWRIARVHTHIHRLMPLGSVQAEHLVNDLGVPASKVEVLPYGIDTEYWQMEKATPRQMDRPYVIAAGLQHRDYRTLVRAADGLDLEVLIAAASPWSKSANQLDGEEQPPGITVESPSLGELRDAYAGAVAVVVPVVETSFPAGTTSILEAMAMSKPVIVSRSEGAGDYVTDRRRILRRGPMRSTSATYAARFGSATAQGQTGLHVPVGDAGELRSVLQWVADHPEEAAAVGQRGRATVTEIYRVEDYVGRIAAAVRSGFAEEKHGS